MCTLIAGIGILGPRTLVLGANRDESPERASAGPGVLRERPRVVGGKDLVAGGTWLAVREARAVTALMNRRPSRDGGAPRSSRSRGLLCLEAAAAGWSREAVPRIDPGTGEVHPVRLHAVLGLVAREPWAACTLVGLDLEEPSWAVLAEDGAETGVRILEEGWNVLTHADVNDPAEPRTAWLRGRLERFTPAGVGEALEGIASLLQTHADPDRGIPGVCLHRDRFPTVSSTLIALGEIGGAPGEIGGAPGELGGAPRYLHAAGPPCATPYEDVSGLLA